MNQAIGLVTPFRVETSQTINDTASEATGTA